MALAPCPLTRRERLRAMTIAEIKDASWRQMAAHGAAALSLRAVARDMGMTPSALYRYFESRDDLLTELTVDGFSSLADALTQARERVAGRDVATQWMAVTRAYRRWARSHPTEYALVFGTPIPGYDLHQNERAKAELMRGTGVLLTLMCEAVALGAVDPSPLDPLVTPGLRAQLADWRAALGLDVPVYALAACMVCWTQLQGAVAGELFGHFPPELSPADELFDLTMRAALLRIVPGDLAPPLALLLADEKPP